MRSILKSTVLPSKKSWSDKLQKVLGKNYVNVHSTSLVATHLAVFIHKRLLPIMSNLKVSQFATGIFNKIGNKGGVSISFKIGETSLMVTNCHLSSGHHQS